MTIEVLKSKIHRVTVTGAELDYVGSITIDPVLMDAADLVPLGGGRWAANGATEEAMDARVIQGALEGSNVDPVKSMVSLMEAARNFEMFQKAMQTSDQMDEKLNQMAR